MTNLHLRVDVKNKCITHFLYCFFVLFFRFYLHTHFPKHFHMRSFTFKYGIVFPPPPLDLLTQTHVFWELQIQTQWQPLVASTIGFYFFMFDSYENTIRVYMYVYSIYMYKYSIYICLLRTLHRYIHLFVVLKAKLVSTWLCGGKNYVFFVCCGIGFSSID